MPFLLDCFNLKIAKVVVGRHVVLGQKVENRNANVGMFPPTSNVYPSIIC